MANQLSNSSIKLGSIDLDVEYYFEPGQKGDGIHTPTIPPSVEITNVVYDQLPVMDFLNEIDSDALWLRIETELLKGYE